MNELGGGAVNLPAHATEQLRFNRVLCYCMLVYSSPVSTRSDLKDHIDSPPILIPLHAPIWAAVIGGLGEAAIDDLIVLGTSRTTADDAANRAVVNALKIVNKGLEAEHQLGVGREATTT